MLRKPVPHERQEQTALVKWIRYQPVLERHVLKIDNEGKRSLMQGAMVKQMGLMNGASDLFLAFPTSKHHGLWLEVKRNKRYAKSEMETPSWLAQIKFLERMQSVGYAAHMVFGWEHGVQVIKDYLAEDGVLR